MGLHLPSFLFHDGVKEMTPQCDIRQSGALGNSPKSHSLTLAASPFFFTTSFSPLFHTHQVWRTTARSCHTTAFRWLRIPHPYCTLEKNLDLVAATTFNVLSLYCLAKLQKRHHTRFANDLIDWHVHWIFKRFADWLFKIYKVEEVKKLLTMN